MIEMPNVREGEATALTTPSVGFWCRAPPARKAQGRRVRRLLLSFMKPLSNFVEDGWREGVAPDRISEFAY